MIWLVAREQSPAAQEAVEKLFNFAATANIPAQKLSAGEQPQAGDTLVVLGGDGTLIQTARRFGALGLPMVAINLGRLGYVTSFTAGQARQALQALVDDALVEEQRIRLRVRWNDAQEGTALNEALVTSGQPGRICSVALRIGDQPATGLRGDGVLVATPTGSTAYALSAGGPILVPGMAAMVIVPVAPHSISFRPLVMPHDTALAITPEQDAWLVLDGQERLRLSAGTTVYLSGDAPPLRLLRPREHDHLETLRSKLHWGEWS